MFVVYLRPVSDETCHDRFKMTAKDKFLEAVSQRIAQVIFNSLNFVVVTFKLFPLNFVASRIQILDTKPGGRELSQPDT